MGSDEDRASCPPRGLDGAAQDRGRQCSLGVVGQDEERRGLDRGDDGRHQGLFGCLVRSRDALIVDPHDLLDATDDAGLDARRPAGVGHEMRRTDRLPFECTPQRIGGAIVSDEAHENGGASEGRDIGRHIGGPAGHDPLLIERQDRHWSLG